MGCLTISILSNIFGINRELLFGESVTVMACWRLVMYSLTAAKHEKEKENTYLFIVAI